jgi:hypothetical protein
MKRRWRGWPAMALLGLTVHLALFSGHRSARSPGQAFADGLDTPTPAPSPTPAATGTPSRSRSPMPEDNGTLSHEEAVALIWAGDYERAERALRANLLKLTAANNAERAEILVYLALIANIRQRPDEARASLRQALQFRPDLVIDPVEFPRTLRDMVAEIRADMLSHRARPRPGELAAPVHMLAPIATPPGWKAGGRKWYQRWYVWAGVGAAAPAAIIVMGGGGGARPTATTTPTVTPTLGPGEMTCCPAPLSVTPSCEGVDAPDRGVTEHVFEVGHRNIEVIGSPWLEATIQGDYDSSGIEPDRSYVRIFIENVGLLTTHGPGTSYCTRIGPTRYFGENDRLKSMLEAAVNDDGKITVLVRPVGPVVDNCGGTPRCQPFHEISLNFTYKVREPSSSLR